MRKFKEYEEYYLPYSGMSVCFYLLNTARTYVRQKEEVSVEFLTKLINHIGTLTTRDFQIQMADLYEDAEKCIMVDANTVLNVLYNYGSQVLNILHPEYQQGDAGLRTQLLEAPDICTLQDFMNQIAQKNQIDYIFSKEEIYQRIYQFRKQDSGYEKVFFHQKQSE